MDEEEQGRPKGSAFGIVGAMLLIGGIGLAIYAFAGYEPSVAVYGTSFDRVNNTGLLQRQAMIFYSGCFAAIGGLLCICVSAVLERLDRQ